MTPWCRNWKTSCCVWTMLYMKISCWSSLLTCSSKKVGNQISELLHLLIKLLTGWINHNLCFFFRNYFQWYMAFGLYYLYSVLQNIVVCILCNFSEIWRKKHGCLNNWKIGPYSMLGHLSEISIYKLQKNNRFFFFILYIFSWRQNRNRLKNIQWCWGIPR